MKIPIKGPERFLLMLNLFSPFKPYSLLNNREKQVLAELMYYDYELRGLSEKQRNKLVFDYDTRIEIGRKLGIKQTSVYNIMSSLKKKDIISEKSLVRKHILPYSEEVTISFTDV